MDKEVIRNRAEYRWHITIISRVVLTSSLTTLVAPIIIFLHQRRYPFVHHIIMGWCRRGPRRCRCCHGRIFCLLFWWQYLNYLEHGDFTITGPHGCHKFFCDIEIHQAQLWVDQFTRRFSCKWYGWFSKSFAGGGIGAGNGRVSCSLIESGNKR